MYSLQVIDYYSYYKKIRKRYFFSKGEMHAAFSQFLGQHYFFMRALYPK